MACSSQLRHLLTPLVTGSHRSRSKLTNLLQILFLALLLGNVLLGLCSRTPLGLPIQCQHSLAAILSSTRPS